MTVLGDSWLNLVVGAGFGALFAIGGNLVRTYFIARTAQRVRVKKGERQLDLDVSESADAVEFIRVLTDRTAQISKISKKDGG